MLSQTRMSVRGAGNLLQTAVRDGRLDEVNTMLCKHCFDMNGIRVSWDVDESNTSGDTALMIAVKAKNLQMVKLLLQCGANTDITDGNNTPLIMAVYGQSIEIVSVLLDYHANLSYRNSNDDTAFTLANNTGKVKIPGVTAANNPYRMIAMMLWDAQGSVPTERPHTPFEPNVREPMYTMRGHLCKICQAEGSHVEFLDVEDLLDHAETEHEMPMSKEVRAEWARDITYRTYETESDSDDGNN
jgi:hypothetical protein